MSRIVPALLWTLAVLFVAILVHLGSVLILPHVAPRDAFTRLAAGRKAGVVAVLPRAAPEGGDGPFRDPALASAICRYDLSAGTLRVTAAADGGDFIAVSLHSRLGVPFYALTDRSSNEGRIEIVLMSSAQLEDAESADQDGEPVRDVRVTSPTQEGFVQFDVLPRIGGYAAAELALKSVSCKIEAGH